MHQMKIADLMKFSLDLLKFLSENEVKVDDWRFVAMYERFAQMRKQGVKYAVAVDELAKEYGTSRATVERVIKRLKKEC